MVDYVVKTGMLHPFDPSPERLKPASYALRLLGKVVWWDPDGGRRRVIDLKVGQEFELQPTAIAFVTLEPMLRIPDYIAVRFNLKIKHIYRGLLLGTGPLIDPGFVGRLSLPLHNLTTNNYTLRGGDDLIWMEFTKVSPNSHRDIEDTPAAERVGFYQPFTKRTDDHDVETYIDDAVGRRPVISSISGALQDAVAEARSARRWTIGGVAAGSVALLGLVAAMLALFVSMWSLRNDTPSRGELNEQHSQIAELQTQVVQLKEQLLASKAATKKP